jgi:uncharacterized protein (TIGR03083 family)
MLKPLRNRVTPHVRTTRCRDSMLTSDSPASNNEPMLGGSSISIVLDVYRPERDCMVDLLGQLGKEDWDRPTECPAYSVKGIATHVLGDDLSLLSRQRDGSVQGLLLVAEKLPGASFRQLLDGFNDQWVDAARFLSTELLVELLRLTGEWTAHYYENIDSEKPGEPVGLFGTSLDSTSPYWQAISREYLERWVHHSQIRRALGMPSLCERRFLEPGVEVYAAITRVEPGVPSDSGGVWSIGPVVLGPAQQTADILTWAHAVAKVRQLITGPKDFVELFAELTGRD